MKTPPESNQVTCKATENLLGAYVFDDLSAAEAARVEKHLEQCENCRNDVAAMRRVVTSLTQELTAEDAPVLSADIHNRLAALPVSVPRKKRILRFASSRVILQVAATFVGLAALWMFIIPGLFKAETKDIATRLEKCSRMQDDDQVFEYNAYPAGSIKSKKLDGAGAEESLPIILTKPVLNRPVPSAETPVPSDTSAAWTSSGTTVDDFSGDDSVVLADSTELTRPPAKLTTEYYRLGAGAAGETKRKVMANRGSSMDLSKEVFDGGGFEADESFARQAGGSDAPVSRALTKDGSRYKDQKLAAAVPSPARRRSDRGRASGLTPGISPPRTHAPASEGKEYGTSGASARLKRDKAELTKSPFKERTAEAPAPVPPGIPAESGSREPTRVAGLNGISGKTANREEEREFNARRDEQKLPANVNRRVVTGEKKNAGGAVLPKGGALHKQLLAVHDAQAAPVLDKATDETIADPLDTPDGPRPAPNPEPLGADRLEQSQQAQFKHLPVNPFQLTADDHQSTFGLDTDTASYRIAQNYLRNHQLPPRGAIRMEEFVNAFDYNYPRGSRVFNIHAEGAPSPFRTNLTLLKIGVQGRIIGREARQALVESLGATAQYIAKDAKIHVEFNKDKVRRYRLIGYENRDIADKDFHNDSVDAGEVASGQSATALYELELIDQADPEFNPDLGTVYVRYRNMETSKVEELSQRISPDTVHKRTVKDDPRFFLAASAAEFAEHLRGSEYVQGSSLEDVRRLLEQVAIELPLDKGIKTLLNNIRQAEKLTGRQ